MYKLLCVIALGLFLNFDLLAQNAIEAKLDSMKLLIENSDSDTFKTLKYLEIGEIYVSYKPEKGIELGETTLRYSKKINSDKAFAWAYINMFGAHFNLNSPPDSLLYYIQLLEETAKKTGRVIDSVHTYWCYGNYYEKLGQDSKAVDAFTKALEVAKQDKEYDYLRSRLLTIINSLLYENGNPLETLETFRQTAKSKKQTLSSVGAAFYGMGSLFSRSLNQLDSAKIYLDKAQHLAETSGDYRLLIATLTEQAYLLDLKEDFETANSLYFKALDLIGKYNLEENKMRLYKVLAEHYLLSKKYQLAIQYGEQVLDYTKQENDNSLNEVFEILDKCYTAIGNYPKAHEMRGLIIAHKDSISNEILIEKVEEAKTKFDVEQKELENELLKAEKTIANKSARNSLAIAIGSVIILLLLAGWTYFMYKTNQERTTQNELLLKNKAIIEAQSEKLQVLYDYKNKLFINIAHELRTPLTLIKNPIKTVLRSGNIQEHQAKQLRIADRNIRSLSSTIHQILDLAKRDNVEIAVQPIQFDVNELIHYIANDFKSMAQFKSIELIKPAIGLAIPVITDGEKLMIVIRNLLSNAFKFTPTNGKVSVSLMDLGEEVAINVKDTGKGLTADDLEKIFDRHFQVNPANLPNEGGMGIGLAISKEYMTLIKGSINAESEPEKGSSFILRFPKQLVQTSEIHQEASMIFNNLIAQNPIIEYVNDSSEIITSVHPSETTTSILIVEDNVDMSNYLNGILSEEHNIHFAQDGEKALKILEKHRPDLIISDYMMPNMNGLELIEELKSKPEYAGIPVIMLTAQQAMDVKLNALRIGVDDYLTKPFDNRELTARVNNIFANQNNIKAAIQEEAETAATESTTPTMNLEDLAWLEEVENIAMKYISNPDFTISQLAEEIAMSYSNIFRKVKKLTGLSPNQYLKELRFQEARKLLETKKYASVKAVCYSIGYRNVKNFSKNFKKRFGKNPSEYLV